MELFFTGKTVEAATEAALEQLGIAREDISIEVVEMPVKKLFRSIPAKIRVTLIAEEEENARKAEKEAAVRREEKPAKKKQDKPAKAEKAPKTEKPAPKAEKPAPKAEKPVETKKEPVTEVTAPVEAAQPAEVKETKEISPEKIELAKTFLETVAADMGVEGFVVTPQQQDETLVLKVEGDNLGILIGRRGETMEALSYLTGLVTNRIGGDYQKVALDVAGYRSKRESDLVALAKRAGARVQKTGRSYTMDPMNPYERRIIHSTIGKMEGVTSESTGEGEDRRVVISSTDPNAVKTPERTRSGKGGKRGGRGNGRGNGGSREGGNREGGSRGGRGNGRGGRGNGGGQRREAGRTEYKERSREQTSAPVAGERTEVVNDAPSVSLYGKIEL